MANRIKVRRLSKKRIAGIAHRSRALREELQKEIQRKERLSQDDLHRTRWNELLLYGTYTGDR